MIKKNKDGVLVDERGKKVNERGYLIDKFGNIVDKENNKIFDAKHLQSGEPPKIFKFNKKVKPGKLRGNFDCDPLGNPILT